MKRLLHALFIFNLLANVVTERANCRIINKWQDKRVTLICTGLTNLTVLKEGYSNSTSITISDSRIYNIPGYSFERFGASLVTLDLHGSDIQTISPAAFGNLTKLENLLLWGNKLTTVNYEWFLNMNVYSLKTLDVSFNNISMIYDMVFTMLPNLENFYFDYNKIEIINFQMFDYLRNLKNVKFEKNPWFWGYRAHLTWKFETMNVNYGKDWDEWEWMNAAIKECSQNGHGVIPQDTVLDCIVENLLNYTYELSSTEQQDTKCIREAQQLVRCMRPKNITGNTDNETARRILEDYTAILPTMFRSNVLFKPPQIRIP